MFNSPTVGISALLLIALLPISRVHAQLATLTQQATGLGNEYVLYNASPSYDSPHSFTAFAVGASQLGGMPTTPNLGWISQPLDALAWEQPMGGSGAERYTWHEFTGKAFFEIFLPGDPCYGFFIDYGLEEDAYRYIIPVDPCLPSQSLGGFFFDTPAFATSFVVSGVFDLAAFAGDPELPGEAGIQTFVGQSHVVPEPTGFVLSGLGLVGLFGVRHRFAIGNVPKGMHQ